MAAHTLLPQASAAIVGRKRGQVPQAIAAPARLQEPPTRKQRLGPTVEQAMFQEDFFARFRPETWVTADLPIEEAATPPSSWYYSPEIWELEKEAIFARQWTFVGHSSRLQKPGDYITGDIAGNRYLICKDESGELRAYHNTCHHRAMAIAEGSGCTKMFECKYHGWKYDLKGSFRGCTQMEGVKRFYSDELSLRPIRIESLGPFMFVLFNNDQSKPSLREYLGTALPRMLKAGMEADDLQWVHQDTYPIACNWKVFNDNYLDTCYHCGFAHPGLSAALDLSQYTNEVHDNVSFQLSPLASSEDLQSTDPSYNNIVSSRIEGTGEGPTYAYVYPNLMLNRYSTWQDTLHVIPTGPESCIVHIDYFVKKDKVQDADYIRSLVQGEHEVQVEDLGLCEGVQAGLRGPAYDVGRYSPHLEKPNWSFHQLVRKHLHTPSNVPV